MATWASTTECPPASMCCEAHKENISRGGRHWLHRLQVASSRIVENLWRACSWLMAVSRVGLFSMYSVSGAGAVSLMLLMESRNSPGLFECLFTRFARSLCAYSAQYGNICTKWITSVVIIYRIHTPKTPFQIQSLLIAKFYSVAMD